MGIYWWLEFTVSFLSQHSGGILLGYIYLEQSMDLVIISLKGKYWKHLSIRFYLSYGYEAKWAQAVSLGMLT